MARPTRRADQLINSDLPEFRNPPVAEVACSIQFNSIGRLDAPRLGLLWTRFRDRYPTTETHAPLTTAVELFGPPTPAEVRVEVLPAPPLPRVWFLDSSGARLIQVQHDRFVVNWRRERDAEYPRFPSLRHTLEAELGRFEDFLREEELGDLTLNQVELTYVNHIPAGTEPSVRQPLADFVRLWAGEPADTTYLQSAEQTGFECSYVMVDSEGKPIGRLHIRAESQFRRADKMPVYGLTLVGRGAPPEQRVDAALRFMDQQHEWIVRTFTEITTPTMHKVWERTR